jgi:acetyl esterase
VALDEATQAMLAQMAQAGGKPLHEMTPAQARAMSAAGAGGLGAGPEMTRVSDATVVARDGAFRVRVLVPSEAARGVIVYYHGGGWVIGTLDETDALGRLLAKRTECAVVLVEYRLAPEHRYPTAAEDAWSALRWADEHLDSIAGSRVPLLVAGDSSGANLAAVAAQRAAAEGAPRLAMQVLVYPVTDADLDTASYRDPGNQLMISRASMVWFWDMYAPDPASRRNPDASPLRAADVSGVPPTVIVTAEHDVLRDEGEAYAEKLRAAGVPVEQRRFDGQMHGFFSMVNVLPGGAAAMDYIAGHIGRLLGAPSYQ